MKIEPFTVNIRGHQTIVSNNSTILIKHTKKCKKSCEIAGDIVDYLLLEFCVNKESELKEEFN